MRIDAVGCALRPVCDGDVAAIARACGDPEIARWLPHLPQPYGEDDARSFIVQAADSQALGRELAFAIVDDHDALLGMIGLRLTDEPPTVGYWMAPEARGRGLASAATRAVTAWAFVTYGPARIALHAEPANVASCRVAETCGFVRRAGTIKGADDRDLAVFELVRPIEAGL
jgi:RimJ/RimL family protein N-acetyltransferase